MEIGSPAGAAMDMSQFVGAFLEEAAEHLAAMETLLVRIDLGAPAADELNAIFRAAHSIKGGSGMFGFHDTTAVTHELESLLDRVRKRELALTPRMVDVLLEASDLLRAQLACHARQGAAPEVPVDVMCARIRACGVQGHGAKGDSGPAMPEPAAAVAPVPALRRLEITFPAAGADDEATNELLAQLGELGTVDAGSCVPAVAPAERAATRTVYLTTDSPDEVVLALFDFIMDARYVRIVATGANPDAAARPPPSAEPAGDAGCGFFETLATAPGDAVAPTRPSTPNPADASQALARETERPAAPVDASIRVSIEKVDELINQVGELVITHAMLAEMIGALDVASQAKLLAGMADLARNTRDLQESVMSIRMLPMGFVFNRFARLVHDLAAKLGKEVRLVTDGESTELDRGLIEKIIDPLTHLVRNAIDHGIERTQARVAAGKSAAGTVTLRAAHRGGNVVIEVSDDGAGLDRARILAKARERGLSVTDAMPDREVWNLIFEPGFSTAETITDVSGRGVGMDVVKRNIGSLSGSLSIESSAGAGTRITVRLPLTLAIMDGMSVAVGGETYILPLSGIVESLQVENAQIRSIAGEGLVISVRNEFLPVMCLFALFNGAARAQGGAGCTMVVVEAEGRKTALMVDALLGQHQVVVKSLDANYRKVPGVSGATIMGNGRVALILDVTTLTRDRRPVHGYTLQ